METTRVSSYIQGEGYKDSAGTMYPYASAVNNLFSGITASANASMISNVFSGLASTITAGQLNGATSYAASCAYATTALAAATSLAAASATYAVSATTAAYAASAGALSGVTVTAGTINAAQYSTAAHKFVYGSTAITASATIGITALGLTTLAAFVYTKTVSCTDYMAFTTTGVVISLMSGATAATGTVYYVAVND